MLESIADLQDCYYAGEKQSIESLWEEGVIHEEGAFMTSFEE